METAAHPANEPAGSPHPRWALLNRYGCPWDSSVIADGDKTTVRSHSSSGRPFRMSFGLASLPASSFIYFDWAEKNEAYELSHVITAHGNTVLIKLWEPQKHDGSHPHDYFIYNAGAGRPPSLSLLPICYIPTLRERNLMEKLQDKKLPWTFCVPTARRMEISDTGLLRCGDGDDNLLVAKLEVTYDVPYDTADLCVLRHGRGWDLKREVPIVPVASEHRWCQETRKYVPVVGQKVLPCRYSTQAIPVGDRFLCWVNYDAGTFLLWDVTEENPKLHYVPLHVDPVEPKEIDYSDSEDDDGEHPIVYCRSIGAAGADAVRLISISPRCCCGGHGRSTCARSRFAFRVSAWILRLSIKGVMTWVRDGLLDSDELWALPGYEGLPRVYLECPIVSSDNPDVVCFIVREQEFVTHEDRKVWMLELDTRRKALLSVCRCTSHPYRAEQHVPVNLYGQ
ncbi:unnamed protein product [Urochloa humidicola]